MSLLMQALKKAERAKLNSQPEGELDKPSEAYDELLSLAPLEAETAPAAAAPAFDLTPLADLSLAPLDAPAASAPVHAEPSLAPIEYGADGLPPIPVLSVASEAIHDPVPPQARHVETPARHEAARPAAEAAPASRMDSRGEARTEPRAEARAQTRSESRAESHAESRADKPAPPRGAARARAAASANRADKPGLDPAKLRLAVLGGIAGLILLVFGYIYWQAVYGPASGSKLPMVPMPPPSSVGAAPQLVVVAKPASADVGVAPAADVQAAGAASDQPATPAATAAPAGAAPPPADMMPAQNADIARNRRDDLQRHDMQRVREQSQFAAQQPMPAAPAPASLPPAMAADTGGIQISRSTQAAQLDPALQSGYSAVVSGDLATAQQQYDSVLARDANNRDALLGSAAVAERQKRPNQASAVYLRLLQLNPDDADALAGLIGLNQGDPGQSELRLQNMLKQNPESGALHFALGNLYAHQGRWPDAQQSFFRAYTAAPGNADYAFNLAVGLDRLNQPKLALTYYQKALALAQDRAANFDRNALRKRMHELAMAQGVAPGAVAEH